METKLLNQTQNLIDKDQKNKFDTVEYANEQRWTFYLYLNFNLNYKYFLHIPASGALHKLT